MRFHGAEQAAEALGKLEEGGNLVSGIKATLRTLEGEEVHGA